MKTNHVDLEEMRADAINCHPHPNGIGREQPKSSRIAEVDRDQRLEGITADDVRIAAPQASLERLRPPIPISAPLSGSQVVR
jgi:hypothetical protein